MKKLFCACLVLAMIFSCAAFALEVDPFHQLNMDDFEMEDRTIRAAFTSADVDAENGVMAFLVYDVDLYNKTDLDALQVGDTILAFNEYYTVETIAENEDYGGYDINGGFIEDGLTFIYQDGNPDVLKLLDFDDAPVMSFLGQAVLQLADEITFNCFQTDGDSLLEGNLIDEMKTVVVAAADLPAILSEVEEMIDFVPYNTRICIENQKITEITLDYMP